eukprot:6681171-Karenia_brevis.AAC.1
MPFMSARLAAADAQSICRCASLISCCNFPAANVSKLRGSPDEVCNTNGADHFQPKLPTASNMFLIGPCANLFFWSRAFQHATTWSRRAGRCVTRR